MTAEEIKRKHKIPKSEEIYHLTVEKDEKEIGEDGRTHWECWLREPTLEEEENIMRIMADKIYTAVTIAIQSLWLEGDDEFKTEKKLIKSSLKFINEVLSSKEMLIEKK